MQLQEITAGSLPSPLECSLRDIVVGQVGRQVVKLAQSGYVGDRFDIEDQNGRHGYSAGSGWQQANMRGESGSAA
jgi:hypothetical protein